MNNSKITQIQPFVKWVGGKRHVINKHLYKMFPNSFNTYIEPFVGGGSVLFHLKPERAIINDKNSELIKAYKAIKNQPYKLMSKIDELSLRHSKEFFNELRKSKCSNNLDEAARFMYLNKTCFNGLYRVNKNNEFNVPFNNKLISKLVVYNKDNLIAISKYLKNNEIQILNQDFVSVINLANKNDFIFCDPPYDYEDDGFDSYTSKPFGKKGQIELFNQLDKLSKKGVKWMMTNHNTTLINELYKEYKIFPIETNRSINSKGSERKNTGKEVVVTNYEW